MPARPSVGCLATNLRPTPTGPPATHPLLSGLAACKAELKPRTYDSYVQMYNLHVFPALGARRISTITSEDIEEWVSKLAQTPTTRGDATLHPSTIKHAVISANKVFRYAIKHRLIVHNPATGVDLPKVQHAQAFEAVFLSPAEVTALGAALDDHAPDGMFVRLAAYTGLRSGEIQALQVRDVNLMRRQLEVRRTLVRTSEGFRQDSPSQPCRSNRCRCGGSWRTSWPSTWPRTRAPPSRMRRCGRAGTTAVTATSAAGSTGPSA